MAGQASVRVRSVPFPGVSPGRALQPTCGDAEMSTMERPSVRRSALVVALVGGLLATASGVASGGTRHLPGTDCPVFPATSYWHADVSALPVHARSAQWLAHMSTDRDLHPDFGPSYGEQPVPYGIPITVVGGAHDKVRVHFTYSSESDHVRYPLGSDTKIEGGRSAHGDRHGIIVDKSTCRLYETFSTYHK